MVIAILVLEDFLFANLLKKMLNIWENNDKARKKYAIVFNSEAILYFNLSIRPSVRKAMRKIEFTQLLLMLDLCFL